MIDSSDIKLSTGEVMSMTWSKVRDYTMIRLNELNNRLMAAKDWDDYVATRSRILELRTLLELQTKQESLEDE